MTTPVTRPSMFSLRFTAITAAAALTAAVAATTSASLGWPVWAMFMGWVAFFTKGHSAREATFSYLCLAAGIVLGTGAVLSVGFLMPFLGPLSFGVVVFVVAMIVVTFRAAAPVNNIPAYFLGLITFFAAHLEPSVLAVVELLSVSALGTSAAWLAHRAQARIN
ncbi:DUF1097 domain-containing protein [Rhizobium sp. NFR03]|uniref:DUF1097 domain-containing protein n=1 Tax=Rhizobium sp. NFR03 TaxID=1566263 RepID=UPI0008AF04AB|nr:DUF1097 domain-containing protein [Rhizobium sp. NFR03]SES47672.1 Protein of unknown function [Rhizobium sp. NFR03]